MAPKSFSLSSHCRFIKGAKCSAVYNLSSGEVFSVNAKGMASLLKAFNGESLEEDDLIFLTDMEKAGLLNNHENPIEDLKMPPRLFYAWLELTDGCNCNCLHCYGAFGKPKKEELQKEMGLSEWKTTIDEIFDLGCRSLQFIGGEPMASPHFKELLSYAFELGFERIDVFTNLTLVNDAIVTLLKKTKASVRFSIYGYDEESHDAITQRKGSFKRLDEAITKLQKEGIPLSPAVILMKENQDHLPKIIDYLHSKNLPYNGFDTVRRVRHSAQESHCVSDPEINKKRLLLKPNFKTSLYHYSMSLKWNNCWFGKVCISSHGDILPCIFARDLKMGNLLGDEHQSIREKLLEKWSFTKDDVEVCKDCEYRYVCEDCRPLAMGECGSIKAKYPRCLYDPYTGIWKEMKSE